jgi:hypothetical protein
MCCIEYRSIYNYLDSIKETYDRIIAIDALIEKNILAIGAALDGPGAGIAMYELDDGQVRIKTNYRSTTDIINANTALEKMKQLYVNRLNGRTTILRDKSTFRGWGGCC